MYKVKELAKMSGVSIRTLHYYDEIGLLTPASISENNYRHYDDKCVLKLQQILFYRELGFTLKQVKKMLEAPDFMTLNALKNHKLSLLGEKSRLDTLIQTIDKTTAYIRGKIDMEHKEIFDGFNIDKQKIYEKELINNGIVTELEVDKSWDKVKYWNKQQWLDFKVKNKKLYQDLTELQQKGNAASSKEVQSIISQHYQLICVFWTPDKQKYIELGEMYKANPDFVKYFKDYGPNLAEFLSDAIAFYANGNLK